MKNSIHETEGQLIKCALGEQWYALSAKTQARFEADPTQEAAKEYTGEMSEVSCSRLGKLFAYVTRFLGAPLIPYSEHYVPIHVRVFKKQNDPAIYKQRTYFFKNHPQFTVQSHMVLNDKGEFHEFSGYGLCMRMALKVNDGSLYFHGNGYFLKLWKFTIPLPLILSPGKTIVKHIDHGDNAFRVRIEMRHPLFGLMFVQDGVFHDREPS